MVVYQLFLQRLLSHNFLLHCRKHTHFFLHNQLQAFPYSRRPETKSARYRVSPPAEMFSPLGDYISKNRNVFGGGEDISRPHVEKVAPVIKISRNETNLC